MKTTRGASLFVAVSIGLLSACSGPPRYTAGAGAHGGNDAYRPPERTVTGTSSWQPLYSDLLGTPYVRGGSSPRGFDCSGLVGYVYRAYDGRDLPRTVSALYRSGQAVSRGDLQAGDLVFYDTDGRGPSHVGIYLWSGTFLHASRSLGVTVSRLAESYYAQRYLGARRIGN